MNELERQMIDAAKRSYQGDVGMITPPEFSRLKLHKRYSNTKATYRDRNGKLFLFANGGIYECLNPEVSDRMAEGIIET